MISAVIVWEALWLLIASLESVLGPLMHGSACYAYDLLGTHEHPEDNKTAQVDKKAASEKTPVFSACTKKDKDCYLHIPSGECTELAT